MAGFEPYDTPACGTFYAFIDRLEDGPYQKPKEGYIKAVAPSKLRKIKHLRNLASEKEQRQKDKEADLVGAHAYDSVTKS